jgi:hypothetical protein
MESRERVEGLSKAISRIQCCRTMLSDTGSRLLYLWYVGRCMVRLKIEVVRDRIVNACRRVIECRM